MASYLGSSIVHNNSQAVADFRSDTVTRPCAGMRAAMANAEVGDDVWGDDPTVSKLEGRLADMLGKEAGVFVPSGTQSNLTAILSHCGRGEEVLLGESYHVFHDEARGVSVLGGVSLHPLSVDAGGGLSAKQISAEIKPDDPHSPITRLLSLENTVGGKVVPLEQMQACSQAARNAGLSVHLDGARFFNAVTALGIEPKCLADTADTVSICLSKGLGAPVGSVLLGPNDLIKKARRNRKLLGGAMRQVGVLAAAGLYSLDNNVERLSEDHQRAERLSARLAEHDQIDAYHATNMVFISLPTGSQGDLQKHLLSLGHLIPLQKPLTRLVIHKDVSAQAIDGLAEAVLSYYG